MIPKKINQKKNNSGVVIGVICSLARLGSLWEDLVKEKKKAAALKDLLRLATQKWNRILCFLSFYEREHLKDEG